MGNQRFGRHPRQLSLDEREANNVGLATGQSPRTTASLLGRAPSMISREVRRNGARHSVRAWRADAHAARFARRQKLEQFRRNPGLRAKIEKRLKQSWPSEQTSKRFHLEFPNDPGMKMSFGTLHRGVRSGRTRWGSPRRRIAEGLRKGRRPTLSGPSLPGIGPWAGVGRAIPCSASEANLPLMQS